ncbi:glycosyltransferase family 8 protein [Novipirellula artificiosorum]|uniref:General stress protein A n=1 Tax=Novipirellula artificiosorum TaxID=2528016 RepID=A0A5C6DMN2_9BACT|nr:glycosyltransferase family 8 protein [Novipirellula artificiosorum]TWU37414.1 General stress protein A [Novipirellula artificiosorum]
MDNAETIVVVCGCDENYAMPLAVTLRSAVDHLAMDRALQVYIFDGGIRCESKQRIEESCCEDRVSIEFVTIDMSILKDVPVSEHVNAASYLRLLIPDVLPRSIGRVIYLDSDLLVCKDLSELWEMPLGENAILAAQDSAAPYLDSSIATSNFSLCARYLAAPRPIANYESLEMSPYAKYFNAGVLVIDVDHWRRERLDEELFACLDQHRAHVLWWDQYALNVVMYGRWGELDMRWNQTAHLFAYPAHGESPFRKRSMALLRKDPWIIHFTSSLKPWNYFCRHPETKRFHHYLSRTSWAGYTAERPDDYLQQIWKYHSDAARNGIRRRKRMIRRFLGTEHRRAG